MLWLVAWLAGCSTPPEGQTAGDCTDRADNDGDGQFDCDDDGCEAGPDCADADTDAVDTDGGDTDGGSDTDATDTDVAVVDDDGDGYGSDVDCDDADDAVHPDATEICGNHVDDDCDGSAGDCAWADDLDPSAVGIALDGDQPADLAGWQVAAAGDVDGDGFDDVLVSAPAADPHGAESGRVYLVNGPVTGELSLDSDATATVQGTEASARAGESIAGLGDVNHDGNDDFAIGAPGAAAGVGVFFGPVVGTVDLTDADVVIQATNATMHLGTVVAGPGDLTGDGIPELMVGAPYADEATNDGGAVYVWSGATIADGDEQDADAAIYGHNYTGMAAVGVGDVTGDGLRDLVTNDSGVMYVLASPLPAVGYADDGEAALSGLEGAAIAEAGDLDGDGYDDLAVGSTGAGPDHFGRVYVFRGPLSGDLDALLADRIEAPVNTPTGDAWGYDVEGAGDVDRDGQLDLLVSMHTSAGEVWLLSGDVSGHVAAEDVVIASFYGPDAYAELWVGRAAGDVDGDGWTDLIVGANYTTGDRPTTGAAYLLLGDGI
jgi:hypothetical protein